MDYMRYMVLFLRYLRNLITMKRLILPGAFLFIIIASSCSYESHPSRGGMPPGQAKKVYGTQSAKPFAPGQRKKQ